jgi:hypothetical protein
MPIATLAIQIWVFCAQREDYAARIADLLAARRTRPGWNRPHGHVSASRRVSQSRLCRLALTLLVCRCWSRRSPGQGDWDGAVVSSPGTGQECQEFANGTFAAGGLAQWQVCLGLVAVAAAVFVLDHVAGLGEVGDDAVGAR